MARRSSSRACRRSCRSPSAACTIARREILAGGYVGRCLASSLADYLNKTGSIILILTLLFLAIILSTQFSFGRLFGVLFQLLRRIAGRRCSAACARGAKNAGASSSAQEVLKKHLEKDGKDKDEGTKVAGPARVTSRTEPGWKTTIATTTRATSPRCSAKAAPKTAPREEAAEALARRGDGRCRRRRAARGLVASDAAGDQAPGADVEPTLPLPDPEKLPAETQARRLRRSRRWRCSTRRRANARSTSAS